MNRPSPADDTPTRHAGTHQRLSGITSADHICNRNDG